jgi:hypothetical protein
MKRSAFTLTELGLVIALVAIVMGLMVSAIQRIRESEARAQTLSHLKQLALALHSCNDNYKMLPPATGTFGKPEAVNGTVHIHLLPFI